MNENGTTNAPPVGAAPVGDVCVRCGRTRAYSRNGTAYLKDGPLCRSCHALWHEKNKGRGNGQYTVEQFCVDHPWQRPRQQWLDSAFAASTAQRNGNGKHDVFIAESPAMCELMATMKTVASTDAGILLLGETGTGKTLVALQIHQMSQRMASSFVDVGCTNIPVELFEAEVFGVIKGAYTGAHADRRGMLENNGATVFLDEVGDLPPRMQAKFLDVLDNHRIRRVGANNYVDVNLRFIAATNKNLEKMVREGSFREDLFHRLNVFSLTVPPLRERRDEIPALVEHFRKQLGHDCEVADEVLAILQKYPWPGNLRELRNVLERALILANAEDGVVLTKHVTFRPLSFASGRGVNTTTATGTTTGGIADFVPTPELREAVQGFLGSLGPGSPPPVDCLEKIVIQELLAANERNILDAAHSLGMGRQTVYNKIKAYGMESIINENHHSRRARFHETATE